MKIVLAALLLSACASVQEDAGKLFARQVNAFCSLPDEAKQRVADSASEVMEHDVTVTCAPNSQSF